MMTRSKIRSAFSISTGIEQNLFASAGLAARFQPFQPQLELCQTGFLLFNILKYY
jgi:hypothetical protein